MLTLPETLAALRALDTMPDILHQACERIIAPPPQVATSGPNSDLLMAHRFIAQCSKTKTPPEMLNVFCLALAHAAALSVKCGAEHEMLLSLTEMFADYFTQSILF